MDYARPSMRCAASPNSATRRRGRRDLDLRASAGLHAGPGRQGRAPAAQSRRDPGRADQSRRPDHLPRARPGRCLSADRPAAAGHLRQGVRLPARALRAAHARGAGVTGHRIAGAPGIYVRLADPFGHAPLESAPPRERLGVAADGAFDGIGKIAALGIKVSRHCTYHGVGAERRDGPGTLRLHQSMRLCRPADGRFGYTRGSCRSRSRSRNGLRGCWPRI